MSAECLIVYEPKRLSAAQLELKFSLGFLAFLAILGGLLSVPRWVGPSVIWATEKVLAVSALLVSLTAEKVLAVRALLAGAAFTTWAVVAVVSVMLVYHVGLRFYLADNKATECRWRAVFGRCMIALYGLVYGSLIILAPSFETIELSYRAFFHGQPAWLIGSSLCVFWLITHAVLMAAATATISLIFICFLVS